MNFDNDPIATLAHESTKELHSKVFLSRPGDSSLYDAVFEAFYKLHQKYGWQPYIDDDPALDEHDLVLCKRADGSVQINRRVSNDWPFDAIGWKPL